MNAGKLTVFLIVLACASLRGDDDGAGELRIGTRVRSDNQPLGSAQLQQLLARVAKLPEPAVNARGAPPTLSPAPWSNDADARALVADAQQGPEPYARMLLREGSPNALSGANADVRLRAAAVLGFSRDRRALQSLLEASVADPDRGVRRIAAQALRLFDEPIAVRRLVDLACANDHQRFPWPLRKLACEALVELGDPQALYRLVREVTYELAAGNPLDPRNKLRGTSAGLGSDNPLGLTETPAPPTDPHDLYPALSALKEISGAHFDRKEKDARTWIEWAVHDGAKLVADWQKRPAPEPLLFPPAIRRQTIALKDVASPDPLRRSAAFCAARETPTESIPALTALLSPKAGSDEYTHIGALRALRELGPLPDAAAKTLSWCAVFDAFPEARREACETITRLQEDRAVLELLRYGLAEAAGQRNAAAVALREIDDPRALAALVRGIPMPAVSGFSTEQSIAGTPSITLPVGPAGARMPIFLPQGSVAGTASDVSNPATDLLKVIARKDLGNLPQGWIYWFKEKTGAISGAAERDPYHDNRSLRERMNVP